MSFERIRKRIEQLERGDRSSDAVLVFENGSRASLRVRDPLGLICEAMRARHAHMEGREPEPNQYSAKLALLGRAESCQTEDSLARLAFELCHQGRGIHANLGAIS